MPPIRVSPTLAQRFCPNCIANPPKRRVLPVSFSGEPTLPPQFHVLMNGINIPLYEMYSVGSGEVIGGNISSFSDTTAALTFELGSGADEYDLAYELDDIYFSDQYAPEPMVPGALVAVPLMLLKRPTRVPGRRSNQYALRNCTKFCSRRLPRRE